ncbi:MAG: hypothetical protein IJY84_02620 [Clostridia bacterium]|nr:hypothetical protein [Clostridia bacterium]
MAKNNGLLAEYDTPKLNVIYVLQDILTLSVGNGEGNIGEDLGGGQIGEEDIFE